MEINEADEVRRALKLLEALIKAHGLTKKALDQKLEKGPGYISQVLTGRLELKFRHILEILEALELDPGLFFRALFLEPETPSQSNRMMERFLESLQNMGYYGERAPLAPTPAPPVPLIDPDELERRIRHAVSEALSEGGSALPQATRRESAEREERRAEPDHRERMPPSNPGDGQSNNRG